MLAPRTARTTHIPMAIRRNQSRLDDLMLKRMGIGWDRHRLESGASGQNSHSFPRTECYLHDARLLGPPRVLDPPGRPQDAVLSSWLRPATRLFMLSSLFQRRSPTEEDTWPSLPHRRSSKFQGTWRCEAGKRVGRTIRVQPAHVFGFMFGARRGLQCHGHCHIDIDINT